jgi:hypothetical protein
MGCEQPAAADGSVACGDVDLGDGRRAHPDAKLAGPRFGNGNLADLEHFRAAEIREGDRVHGNAPFLVEGGD